VAPQSAIRLLVLRLPAVTGPEERTDELCSIGIINISIFASSPRPAALFRLLQCSVRGVISAQV
jgi:hypothetical protein